MIKNFYCNICGKYKKTIFEKTLVLSISRIKFGNEDEKKFKQEESMQTLKIISLKKFIAALKMWL